MAKQVSIPRWFLVTLVLIGLLLGFAAGRRTANKDSSFGTGTEGSLPNLVGLSGREALATLSRAGFKGRTAVIETPSLEVAAGIVVSQEPPPGLPFLGVSRVTVRVSSGPVSPMP